MSWMNQNWWTIVTRQIMPHWFDAFAKVLPSITPVLTHLIVNSWKMPFVVALYPASHRLQLLLWVLICLVIWSVSIFSGGAISVFYDATRMFTPLLISAFSFQLSKVPLPIVEQPKELRTLTRAHCYKWLVELVVLALILVAQQSSWQTLPRRHGMRICLRGKWRSPRGVFTSMSYSHLTFLIHPTWQA